MVESTRHDYGGSYRREPLMLGAPGGERFNPICRPAETHVKISAVVVVQDWLHPCHPVNYQRFIRILTSDISLKVGIRRAEPFRARSMGLCLGGRLVLATLGISNLRFTI